MRWTGQTGNAPVAARSPRQQAPSHDDVKVFHGGARRLQSLWHHDIYAGVNGAQLLLQAQDETLYICVMCFVANFLSSITLDVGSRYPLGQTSGALFFFRRSYNLKITVSATKIISGILATIFLAIGNKSRLPYLYLPWLVNTMKGLAFCEGPALMGIAYVLIPTADLPASSFLFITLLLYVEELCLWNDVFNKFRNCWMEYRKRIKSEFKNELKNKSKKSKPEAANPVKLKPSILKTESVKGFRTSVEPCSIYSNEPEICTTLLPSSPTVSEGFLEAGTRTRTRTRTRIRRIRAPSSRTQYADVTG